MFNSSPDKSRAVSGFNTDSYGFNNQAWSSFDFHQGTPSSAIAPEHGHDARHSFSDVGGMEWAPTPSDVQPDYHHDHHGDTTMEIEALASPQNGGGVGRLVAHFENKGFNPFENKTFAPAPPLPPRPINTAVDNSQNHHDVHHQSAQSQSISMNSFQASLSFDPLPYCGNGVSPGGGNPAFNPNRVASPVASPGESWESFVSLQRVTSPMAASPPAMSFGSFQDGRVASPGVGSSSGHFGHLDDFMSASRMQSPMAHSPMPNSHMASSPMMPSPMTQTISNQSSIPIGGTPGFEIWRPPGTTPSSNMAKHPPQSNSFATPTPPTSNLNTHTNTATVTNSNNHNAGSNTNSAGFFKPPVPTTPKPNINVGNQFILELNPSAKAKGKAPAKPPRPRVLPPVPNLFAAEVKEEPATPNPSEVLLASSTLAPPTPSASLSVS
jgi:hypothetical protein